MAYKCNIHNATALGKVINDKIFKQIDSTFYYVVVSARFIDASRYLSRDSYRDTVCKYRETFFFFFFFFFCSLDPIILDTERAFL